MTDDNNERVIEISDRIQSKLMLPLQRSVEGEIEHGTARVDFVEALIRVLVFHVVVNMGDWINDDSIVKLVKGSIETNFDRQLEGLRSMQMSGDN